jgi:hypothetical protein
MLLMKAHLQHSALEDKLGSYTDSPMLLELGHYVWRALCVHCADLSARACAVLDVGHSVSDSGPGCIPRTSKCLLNGWVQSVVPRISHAKIGQVILSSAKMCIIPWLEWSTENHAYITHKGMQDVTRAALMMLARHGIYKELAQIIIGRFAELMAERQLICTTPDVMSTTGATRQLCSETEFSRHENIWKFILVKKQRTKETNLWIN